MNRQLLGRCIGVIGAAGSAMYCAIGITLFVVGLRAGGIPRLLCIVLWPVALVGVVISALALATIVRLLRGPDARMPLVLGLAHAVPAGISCVFIGGGRSWLPFTGVLLGITALDLGAAWLCADRREFA